MLKSTAIPVGLAVVPRYVALVLSFAFASSAFAQDERFLSPKIESPAFPSSPVRPPIYDIPVVADPPKIDGLLDDSCWKEAKRIQGFFRYQSQEPIKEQTEFWMCQDKTHLYFAFHCLDSHPELIKASETQREGDLSHDDAVIVFIDSQNTKRNGSQFTVSARGTQQTQIEGGSATNLTWAGDWFAATHRTKDGWTAEISIPFSILRYPKGAKGCGILAVRQIARETTAGIWPYVPKEGNSNPLPYVCECPNFYPPYVQSKPLFLPYVLATAGTASNIKSGLDVKYPISTTLAGIATINPDFATIEEAVQNLSFSYTPKSLPDSRPFFAEGNSYFQDNFLFYSQQIQDVDQGLKIVGKQGPTTVYALGTNAGGVDRQTALFAEATQDLGLYSQLGAAVASNSEAGQPGNRVARALGQYGFAKGQRQFSLQGNFTESFTQGTTSDYNDWVQMATSSGPGKFRASAYYTETGPRFVNELGLVPETDLHGQGFDVGQFNQSDKGAVELSSFDFSGSTYRHITGGFFHDDLSASEFLQWRNGIAFSLGADSGKYEPYKDYTISPTVAWNQKTLFQQGSLAYQFGRREDEEYSYLSLSQGILISKPLTVQLNFGLEQLGDQLNTQTILSGTYRLNTQETIGGRLVQQNDQYNLFLSYGRKLRKGTDIFFILGDPNSPTTRLSATLKLVHPF
jgi:hypothetical protein